MLLRRGDSGEGGVSIWRQYIAYQFLLTLHTCLLFGLCSRLLDLDFANNTVFLGEEFRDGFMTDDGLGGSGGHDCVFAICSRCAPG